MNIDVESRLQYLIRNFRNSRKTTFVYVLAAALIAILIFICGSYLFLLKYFEELNQSYYGAILRDVSSFQLSLIGRDTYREDMRNLAPTIQKYRGVDHVWFTDRYGKLIYHTDDAVQGEYRARRLPSEYYESIEQSWKFEGGYPLMHKVILRNKLTMRVSLPLYISGRENHDFILGLDVQRFLFIPYDIRYMLLFSTAYFLFSFLLLFLPVFFLIRWRFREAESQTRMIVGHGVSPAVIGPSDPGPPTEQPAPAPAQPAPAAVQSAKVAEAPEQAPPAPKAMSEEIEQDKIYITFLKQKRSLFSEQDVETDFLQAHNYALHSKGAEGSYIIYQGLGGRHLLGCFSAPSGKPPEIFNVIVEIAEMVRSSLKAGVTVDELLKSYNSYSRKEKRSFEISLALIDEANRSVEYSCSGVETAFYLKDGEESVKELRLENPKLGSLPSKEFGQQLASADINLSKNDLFSLPADNAATVKIGDEFLDDLVRDELVSQRKLAASEIGSNIVKRFESLGLAVKNSLPQTGFIIIKFM
jgi:hypothetical protein